MLRYIQYGRGVAALLVVLFHASGILALSKYFGVLAEPLQMFFSFGGKAGVAFFFVLSGFIIHHAHHKDLGNPAALLPYIEKRLIRIYPTYWIIFSGVFLFAQLSPQLKAAVPSDWLLLLKSLLLLPQNKDVIGGTGAPVLIVAWSLQYEMLFYLMFAFGVLRKSLLIFVLSFWLFLVFLNVFFHPFNFPLSFFASHYIVLFFFGILASHVNNLVHRLPFQNIIAFLSVVIFFSIGLVANEMRGKIDTSGPWFDWAYGLSGAIAILALTKKEAAETPSSHSHNYISRFFGEIGNSSYSLYLIHFPLLSILSKLCSVFFAKNQFTVLVSFLILVAGSVSAALIFHLVIERPILHRLRPHKRYHTISKPS